MLYNVKPGDISPMPIEVTDAIQSYFSTVYQKSNNGQSSPFIKKAYIYNDNSIEDDYIEMKKQNFINDLVKYFNQSFNGSVFGLYLVEEGNTYKIKVMSQNKFTTQTSMITQDISLSKEFILNCIEEVDSSNIDYSDKLEIISINIAEEVLNEYRDLLVSSVRKSLSSYGRLPAGCASLDAIISFARDSINTNSQFMSITFVTSALSYDLSLFASLEFNLLSETISLDKSQVLDILSMHKEFDRTYIMNSRYNPNDTPTLKMFAFYLLEFCIDSAFDNLRKRINIL